MNIQGAGDMNNMLYYVMDPRIVQGQNMALGAQSMPHIMQTGVGFLNQQQYNQQSLLANHGQRVMFNPQQGLMYTPIIQHDPNAIKTTTTPVTNKADSSTVQLSENSTIACAQSTTQSPESSRIDGSNTSAEDITQTLGPVEKAVFNQALYNQTKSNLPSLKKCEHCNVIFNSHAQAQMHYKGKKHARVMYLKRKMELPNNCLLVSPNKRCHENDDADKYLIDPSDEVVDISSQSNDVEPSAEVQYETPITPPPIPVCRIRFNNAMKSEPENLPEEAVLSDKIQQGEAICSDGPQNDPVVSQEIEIEAKYEANNSTDEVSTMLGDSVVEKSEECDSNTVTITTTDPSEESTDSGVTSSGSEVKPIVRDVVLPDPLPSYIKRVERPTVLKESLHCNVCDIYVNSENQMKQHINSLRHKNIQQGIPTPPKPIRDDKPKTKAEQFKCEVCAVTLNSDIQLSQHLLSQRHKNMLEGKPPKPRWTPYDKTQSNIAQLRAAAQMLPFKTINPTIIPTHALPTGFSLASLPTNGASLGALFPQAQPQVTSFIAPNSGYIDGREVIYLSNSVAGYQHPANGLPINIRQTPLLTSAPTLDWGSTNSHLKQ